MSCAEWLASLADGKTPAVNLRPESHAPDSDYVAVDQSRVIRVLRKIAHDLEELTRARRVTDLSTGANDADPRMRLRRRLAEPPIEISLRGTSIQQSRQAWKEYETCVRRAGLPIPLNPYRHLDRSEDAVVSGSRSETHPDRWGATLHLSKKRGHWIPVWHRSGIITRHCMPIPIRVWKGASGLRVRLLRNGPSDHSSLFACTRKEWS